MIKKERWEARISLSLLCGP